MGKATQERVQMPARGNQRDQEMTPAERIAELEAKLAVKDGDTSMLIQYFSSKLDAASTVTGNMMREYGEMRDKLAEANKRIHESAEAYARLFTEKEFADKQLATARQNERERCAKLCEDILLCDSDEKYDNEKAEQIGEGTSWNKAVRSYAKSIRALTNEG